MCMVFCKCCRTLAYISRSATTEANYRLIYGVGDDNSEWWLVITVTELVLGQLAR